MDISYVNILKSKFEERMAANPKYSLRAFARSLQIDPGFLSHLLNKKRKLSVARALEIAPSLKLSTTEKSIFINLVRLESARSEAQQSSILSDLSKHLVAQTVVQMDLQVFAMVANWYHHAILELTFKENFEITPKTVAKNLGITEGEAKLAIERLLSLGLVKIENRKYVKSGGHLNPQGQIPHAGLRQRHKQVLTKAIHALESQPISEREFQSVTMCIDPALLPEAKKRIQEFAWELCAQLESKKRKTVYELSIQLFSLENDKEIKK